MIVRRTIEVTKAQEETATMTVKAFHWFIPLVDPIDLPQGQSWETHPGGVKGLITVSLAARQLDRPSRVTDEFEDLMAAVRIAIPGTPTPTGGAKTLNNPITVIEMVAVFNEGVSPDEDDISGAFDKGIESLKRLVKMYSRVTRDPVPVPSREALPPMIPIILREIDPPDSQGYPGDIGVYLVSTGSLRSAERPELAADKLAAINDLYSSVDRVFSTYVHFYVDARRSLERDGNYRNAVLSCATAAEILLDDLLLHVLWEDAVRPEDAALHFDPRATAKARLGEIGRRLGGQWDANRPGPVKEWSERIASVRNRVVHSGHEPSLAEARAALSSLTDLEKHVFDVACSTRNVKAHVFTALALVGQSGLQRRSLCSKAVKNKLDSWPGPDPIATFARWRDAVTILREHAADFGPSPDPANARIYVVRNPDLSVDWVMEDQGFAAKTDDRTPTLSAGIVANLAKSLERINAEKPAETVSILLDGARGGLPAEGWVLVHRRLPLQGVMIDGADFY